MGKLLIGLLALSSVSAFAGDSCRFDTWWLSPESNLSSTKMIFKNVFTEEECRDEARKGQASDYIIRMTEGGAHIVKTKYLYKSDDSTASGVFKHGRWK